MSQLAHQLASVASLPFAASRLVWRVLSGTEALQSVQQRLGISRTRKSAAPLIWLHIPYVGYRPFIVPLMLKALQEHSSHVAFLVTVISEQFCQQLKVALPSQVIIELAPLDNPISCSLFLRKWQPVAGVFLDLSSMPNLILSATSWGVPLALVNSHVTDAQVAMINSSSSSKALYLAVLQAFQLILPPSQKEMVTLSQLGANLAQMPGWITQLQHAELLSSMLTVSPAAHAPAVEAARRESLGRVPWLAVPIHPADEQAAARLHQKVCARLPGLLTVLAPIQPHDCGVLLRLFKAHGLRVARHSARPLEDGLLDPGVDVLLLDEPGALGTWQHVCEVVLIGRHLLAPRAPSTLTTAQPSWAEGGLDESSSVDSARASHCTGVSGADVLAELSPPLHTTTTFLPLPSRKPPPASITTESLAASTTPENPSDLLLVATDVLISDSLIPTNPLLDSALTASTTCASKAETSAYSIPSGSLAPSNAVSATLSNLPASLPASRQRLFTDYPDPDTYKELVWPGDEPIRTPRHSDSGQLASNREQNPFALTDAEKLSNASASTTPRTSVNGMPPRMRVLFPSAPGTVTAAANTAGWPPARQSHAAGIARHSHTGEPTTVYPAAMLTTPRFKTCVSDAAILQNPRLSPLKIPSRRTCPGTFTASASLLSTACNTPRSSSGSNPVLTAPYNRNRADSAAGSQAVYQAPQYNIAAQPSYPAPGSNMLSALAAGPPGSAVRVGPSVRSASTPVPGNYPSQVQRTERVPSAAALLLRSQLAPSSNYPPKLPPALAAALQSQPVQTASPSSPTETMQAFATTTTANKQPYRTEPTHNLAAQPELYHAHMQAVEHTVSSSTSTSSANSSRSSSMSSVTDLGHNSISADAVLQSTLGASIDKAPRVTCPGSLQTTLTATRGTELTLLMAQPQRYPVAQPDAVTQSVQPSLTGTDAPAGDATSSHAAPLLSTGAASFAAIPRASAPGAPKPSPRAALRAVTRSLDLSGPAHAGPLALPRAASAPLLRNDDILTPRSSPSPFVVTLDSLRQAQADMGAQAVDTCVVEPKATVHLPDGLAPVASVSSLFVLQPSTTTNAATTSDGQTELVGVDSSCPDTASSSAISPQVVTQPLLGKAPASPAQVTCAAQVLQLASAEPGSPTPERKSTTAQAVLQGDSSPCSPDGCCRDVQTPSKARAVAGLPFATALLQSPVQVGHASPSNRTTTQVHVDSPTASSRGSSASARLRHLPPEQGALSLLRRTLERTSKDTHTPVTQTRDGAESGHSSDSEISLASPTAGQAWLPAASRHAPAQASNLSREGSFQRTHSGRIFLPDKDSDSLGGGSPNSFKFLSPLASRSVKSSRGTFLDRVATQAAAADSPRADSLDSGSPSSASLSRTASSVSFWPSRLGRTASLDSEGLGRDATLTPRTSAPGGMGAAELTPVRSRSDASVTLPVATANSLWFEQWVRTADLATPVPAPAAAVAQTYSTSAPEQSPCSTLQAYPGSATVELASSDSLAQPHLPVTAISAHALATGPVLIAPTLAIAAAAQVPRLQTHTSAPAVTYSSSCTNTHSNAPTITLAPPVVLAPVVPETVQPPTSSTRATLRPAFSSPAVPSLALSVAAQGAQSALTANSLALNSATKGAELLLAAADADSAWLSIAPRIRTPRTSCSGSSVPLASPTRPKLGMAQSCPVPNTRHSSPGADDSWLATLVAPIRTPRTSLTGLSLTLQSGSGMAAARVPGGSESVQPPTPRRSTPGNSQLQLLDALSAPEPSTSGAMHELAAEPYTARAMHELVAEPSTARASFTGAATAATTLSTSTMLLSAPASHSWQPTTAPSAGAVALTSTPAVAVAPIPTAAVAVAVTHATASVPVCTTAAAAADWATAPIPALAALSNTPTLAHGVVAAGSRPSSNGLQVASLHTLLGHAQQPALHQASRASTNAEHSSGTARPGFAIQARRPAQSSSSEEQPSAPRHGIGVPHPFKLADAGGDCISLPDSLVAVPSVASYSSSYAELHSSGNADGQAGNLLNSSLSARRDDLGANQSTQISLARLESREDTTAIQTTGAADDAAGEAGSSCQSAPEAASESFMDTEEPGTPTSQMRDRSTFGGVSAVFDRPVPFRLSETGAHVKDMGEAVLQGSGQAWGPGSAHGIADSRSPRRLSSPGVPHRQSGWAAHSESDVADMLACLLSDPRARRQYADASAASARQLACVLVEPVCKLLAERFVQPALAKRQKGT